MPTFRSARVAVAIGVVVLMSFGAACGGGSGSEGSTDTTGSNGSTSPDGSTASTAEQGAVVTPEQFCANIESFKKTAAVLPTIDMSDTAPVPPTKAKMLEVVEALQYVLQHPPADIVGPAAEADALIERVRRAVEAATTMKQLKEQVPVVIKTLTADAASLSRLAPIQKYAQEHCPGP